MRDDQRRPFHLADGMILVAATAIGLALAIWSLQSYPPSIMTIDKGTTSKIVGQFLTAGLHFVLPLMASWTLAILLIRLRPPWPRWRRLASEPGFVGCLAATVALGLCSLMLVASLGSRLSAWLAGQFFLSYTAEPAFAVLGAWLTLAITRRWRPAPGWLDRAGRILATSWFLANALNAGRIVIAWW